MSKQGFKLNKFQIFGEFCSKYVFASNEMIFHFIIDSREWLSLRERSYSELFRSKTYLPLRLLFRNKVIVELSFDQFLSRIPEICLKDIKLCEDFWWLTWKAIQQMRGLSNKVTDRNRISTQSHQNWKSFLSLNDIQELSLQSLL